MREFNEPKLVPFKFKWVLKKEDADIVLSARRDLCDYFALGVYCLARSIKDPENTVVRVCFSLTEYVGEDASISVVEKGVQYHIFKNPLGKQIYENVNTIADYYFGRETIGAKVIIALLYPEFTATLMGRIDSPSITCFFPAKHRMRDTLSAQKFAQCIIKQRLWIAYPNGRDSKYI